MQSSYSRVLVDPVLPYLVLHWFSKHLHAHTPKILQITIPLLGLQEWLPLNSTPPPSFSHPNS